MIQQYLSMHYGNPSFETWKLENEQNKEVEAIRGGPKMREMLLTCSWKDNKQYLSTKILLQKKLMKVHAI